MPIVDTTEELRQAASIHSIHGSEVSVTRAGGGGGGGGGGIRLYHRILRAKSIG